MKRTHLILLLLMNLCWAVVFSAYKVLGTNLPVGAIVTLRFGLAAACLLVFWPWMPGQAPKRAALVRTCLMGLIVVVLGQRMQVYGNQLGTAGNSSVLIAIEPLLTSLAAAVFLREHLGPRRLAGFGFGILGVLILNGVWKSDFRMAGLEGSLIVLASFACEASCSIIGKPITLQASAIKMVTLMLLTGTAGNLLIDGRQTLHLATSLPTAAWGIILVLAIICTSLGYTVWFVVIRQCPINVAALTIFAQSVFGVLAAALWLGEKLRWEHLFGGLAIVGGMVLGLSRQVQKEKSYP